jgi:hypothetical protein
MDGGFGAGPEVSPAVWLGMFERGEHEALCDDFLRVLQYFAKNTFENVGPGNQPFFDTFMELFLTLMAQERLVVPMRLASALVTMNHTISNLAAISKYGTTDLCLQQVLPQENNLIKVLALLSARNKIQVDRQVILDTDANLGSQWYGEYAALVAHVADAAVAENLRQHFHFSHPALVATNKAPYVQYGSTYVGDDCDRAIKPLMNASLRRWFGQAGVAMRNAAQPRKIGVVSGVWQRGHSAYRILAAFLEALRGKYELTLVHLGAERDPAQDLFDRVVTMGPVRSAGDVAALQDNPFAMVIYPEVGMQAETTVLSNLRIAPIQVCLLGHSVSTYGSEIDYFVSGAACEEEGAERHYAERLVLLPGMGVVHEKPTYMPRGRERKDAQVIVNCAWTSQKMHHRLLATVRRMVEGSEGQVLLRIFPGGSTKQSNDYIPLARELERALGQVRFELMPRLSYELYMRLMEEGDFTLDAFHFGGCNTVSDSLYLRLPTICWEGDKWYNRIGPEMLRRVGLGECVARDEESYVALGRRMIADGAWRAEVAARLRAANLDATIYAREEAEHFAAAIEYLLEHHGRLRSEGGRAAVRVG